MTSDWLRKIRVDDWQHFKKMVSDIGDRGLEDHCVEDLIFRGQPLGSFSLSASLDRENSALNIGRRNELQDRILRQFQRRNPGLAVGRDPLELLGLLQHNGCPTRVLDWSSSPYVAAFFALSDTLRYDSDEEHCAVWALWREAPPLAAGAGIGVLEPSFAGNERSKAQRGLFTTNNSLSPTLVEFINDWDRGHPLGGTVLWQYLIPRKAAVGARRDLALMGIDHESLFPDTTGAARAAYFAALEREATTS
ncbi:FRG domain-containing protein [Pengzhenrongella sp.]|jgi:hypothetical protein|uniref:FRG domain-containing protein n=1 Tax=Pengzhenrongella sp. TaxID=2888820 RepID=UPI002F957EFE